MRSSTVRKICKIDFAKIEDYCLHNNCGWIFRYKGQEFGVEIVNGKLNVSVQFFRVVGIPLSKIYIRKG